jgi:neutral ceramidase
VTCPTAAAVLRAGAGRSPIAIPAEALPLDGFHTVHDPLSARVLALDDGTTRVALAVVDQTSVFEDQLTRLLTLLHQATGAPYEHCLVVASHTFSAPHVFPPDRLTGVEAERNALLSRAVDDAVQRAAEDAVKGLRPARLGTGDGVCRVNVNRDVRTPEGWWLGSDDGGPSDHTVAVLRIDDEHGRPIALLMNYAVQSSVMQSPAAHSPAREVSADLAGAACREMEEHLREDGAVALFLPGAAGDQAPYLTTSDPAAARVLLAALGSRLAQEALRTADAITTGSLSRPLGVVSEQITVEAQVPPPELHALCPTRSYPYRSDGRTQAVITLLRIGDLAIAGLQAELGVRTGLAVKAASTAPVTWIATMVNGGAKYMADADSYDRCTYEAMNSRYARGTAEAVAARLAKLLGRSA